MEMIPGIDFDFGGGQVRTIPPLSLAALRRMQGALGKLSAVGALEPEAIDTVIKATHAALRRNYPDISEDDVAELIDVANMHEVIACVLDVAGVKRKAGEEAKNPPAQPMQAATPAPTGQD
jgi:hypothetical protein